MNYRRICKELIAEIREWEHAADCNMRQLRAKDAKIARLEEAGDGMSRRLDNIEYFRPQFLRSDVAKAWQEAKA